MLAAALGGQVGVCLGLASAVRADDACASAPLAVQGEDTTAVLARAKALAAQGDYAHARGLYEGLLAQTPELRDARLGLARTHGWAHCYRRAESGYRALLRTNPADAEARAGLIDVLLWQDRRGEATQVLEQGLVHSARSAELWQRRSLLALRNDDRQQARTAAERALALAPQDPELRALRERIYMSVLHASVRLDAFPADSPDLYKGTLGIWHRLGRFELSADALVQDRAGGALAEPIVDGLYTLGAGYHTGPLASFGFSAGLGAPARALPRYLGRVWLSSNFVSHWSAGLSYALWRYASDKTAHIVAPELAFTPDDDWRFELRGWATWLVAHDAVSGNHLGTALALGARVERVIARGVKLAAAYTYGPQLDHVVLSPDFVRLTSHVLALSADVPLGRSYGLQPIAGLEHRQIQQRAQWIWSAELGAYMRW